MVKTLEVFFSVLFLFLIGQVMGQSKPALAMPLDIPLVLSGNFGELRTNHFHTGLDFKTQGREGFKVYSVLDGYVSRVKVSAYGYGKALYINHPGGYTSVYAHLSGYYPELDDWIKSEQYRLQKFEVDLYPDKERFQVKKGTTVGYSGNSGGSGGPHLHFEIRDSASEHPLNVLEFDLPIADSRAPDIKGLKIYCMSDSTVINGLDKDLYLAAEKSAGIYKVKNAGAVKISGPFAIGVHTTDRLDASESVCGIYRMEVVRNEEVVFSQKIDRLNFDLKKHVNAHIDFKDQRVNNRDIHKCFTLPGNKLKLYSNVKDRGVIHLEPGSKSNFTVRVWDVAGNLSTLNFEAEDASSAKLLPHSHLSTYHPGAISSYFEWNKANSWKTDNCEVYLPGGSLFDDMSFDFREAPALPSALTPTFEIGDVYTPLSKDFEVKIRMPESYAGNKSKLIIVRQDPHNGKQTAIKSKINGDFLTAESSFFGWFFIAEDNAKPVVKSIDFVQNLKGKKHFSFKITDNLSGISACDFYIDGKWALADHDGKTSTFTYTPEDKYLSKGSHKLFIVATDVVGNKVEYKADFEW